MNEFERLLNNRPFWIAVALSNFMFSITGAATKNVPAVVFAMFGLAGSLLVVFSAEK